MADPTGVRVAWSKILHRMGDEDGAEVDTFLIFRDDHVKGSPEALMNDLDDAIATANRALDQDGEELVYAEGPLVSIRGPMIYVRYTGTREQNRVWVDTLAAALEAAGRAGSLTVAPRASYALFSQVFDDPKVTGFVAYTPAEPVIGPRGASARIDPVAIPALCADAVEWGKFPGADVYFSQGMAMVMMQTPGVARELANAVRQSPAVNLAYGRNNPPGYNSISFGPNGQVCYQAHITDTPWRDRLAKVQQALLRDPARLDLAFIRWRSGGAPSWTSLAGVKPPFPHVTETDLRYNRHLWAHYTPDAHGIQILTQSHVENAADLSGWQVTELPGRRYLVEAKHLDAWYAEPVPDAATLNQARADFGAMILTPEAIGADPDGWVIGKPPHPAASPGSRC